MNDPAVIEFPSRRAVPRAAVIGAGLSGLICAERLIRQGWPVTVFDKGRGPGGRMATRRADDLRFDHGAQYFTARDQRFRDRVDAWVHDGVVALWNGRIVRIGAERDAGGITGRAVRRNTGHERAGPRPGDRGRAARPASGSRPSRRTGGDGVWKTSAAADLGSYDMVAVAVPSPQAVPLLAEAPDLASRAADAVMAGCWTVMARFERRLDLGYDGAFVTGSPLSWIARDSSKPGRPDGEAWVLHASPEWSQQHIEDEQDTVIKALTAALRDLGGQAAAVPTEHLAAHRWRFSLPVHALDEECLFDPERGLGACGDWCNGAQRGRRLSQRAGAGGADDRGGAEVTGLTVTGERHRAVPLHACLRDRSGIEALPGMPADHR